MDPGAISVLRSIQALSDSISHRLRADKSKALNRISAELADLSAVLKRLIESADYSAIRTQALNLLIQHGGPVARCRAELVALENDLASIAVPGLIGRVWGSVRNEAQLNRIADNFRMLKEMIVLVLTVNQT
jgi:hypothetical protein